MRRPSEGGRRVGLEPLEDRRLLNGQWVPWPPIQTLVQSVVHPVVTNTTNLISQTLTTVIGTTTGLLTDPGGNPSTGNATQPVSQTLSTVTGTTTGLLTHSGGSSGGGSQGGATSPGGGTVSNPLNGTFGVTSTTLQTIVSGTTLVTSPASGSAGVGAGSGGTGAATGSNDGGNSSGDSGKHESEVGRLLGDGGLTLGGVATGVTKTASPVTAPAGGASGAGTKTGTVAASAPADVSTLLPLLANHPVVAYAAGTHAVAADSPVGQETTVAAPDSAGAAEKRPAPVAVGGAAKAVSVIPAPSSGTPAGDAAGVEAAKAAAETGTPVRGMPAPPAVAPEAAELPRAAKGSDPALRDAVAPDGAAGDEAGGRLSEAAGPDGGADDGWPSLVPQTVRDLMERLPADARAADLALQGFLEQVERLGGITPGTMKTRSVLSWVLAGVALGAAFEATRRRPRRAVAGVPASDRTWSWWTDSEGRSSGRNS